MPITTTNELKNTLREQPNEASQNDVIAYISANNGNIEPSSLGHCLFLAAKNGHAEVVEHLIVLPEIVGYTSSDQGFQSGINAFREAASNGYLEIIKLLLNLQTIAKLAVSESVNFTEAAKNGHTEVLAFLAKLVLEKFPQHEGYITQTGLCREDDQVRQAVKGAFRVEKEALLKATAEVRKNAVQLTQGRRQEACLFSKIPEESGLLAEIAANTGDPKVLSAEQACNTAKKSIARYRK